MKFYLSAKSVDEIKTGWLVLPVFEGETVSCPEKLVNLFVKDNPKFGKANDLQLIVTNEQKLLLVGLGKKEKVDFTVLQNWAGTAVKYLSSRVKEATIVIPEVNLLSDKITEAVIIGAEIATYEASYQYKSEKEPVKLSNLELVVERVTREQKEGIGQAQALASSINLVRRLGDMPGNEMTPTYFVQTAKKVAKEVRLKLAVLDEKKAKVKKMGAFSAVAQGSDQPSYVVVLNYEGNPKSKEKWGLVGKGVTFDSGGISIKPSSQMHEMKYDMAGAATVLALAQLVARLRLKVNLVAVAVVTENLPSGKALKPGDIVKSYSGKTIEVVNTDAEGRLLVLDGLTLAQRDYKATKLIDLATLTGAIAVALGGVMTGVFSNNQEFAEKLIQAGHEMGEKFWLMPMDEEYNEMIKSDIADIANIGHGGPIPGAAGSITGAKIIEMAVEGKPWIHLDIAGTAWDLKSKPYRGPGATGIGVKTLLELLARSTEEYVKR